MRKATAIVFKVLAVIACFILVMGQGTFRPAGFRTTSLSTTVGPGDCGGEIFLSGAFTTLTWPAASTLGSYCKVKVWNLNTARGQAFSGLGINFTVTMGGAGLYPGQSGVFAAVNGSYAIKRAPGRWRLGYAPSGPTPFWVDPAGNDNNDCLATGAANACRNIQTAVNAACYDVDAEDNNPQVNLDATSTTAYSGGAFVSENCLGGNSISITGNIANPSSVVVNQGSNSFIFGTKDKGFLVIAGVELLPLVSGVNQLSCGQYSNIDASSLIFSNGPGGNGAAAADFCTINFNAPNAGGVSTQFVDNVGGGTGSVLASFFSASTARIQINDAIGIAGKWTVTYSCLAQYEAMLNMTAGSITLAGGASVTGQKWLAQFNSTVLGSSQCPGSVAGVPAVGSSPFGGQAN